MKNQIVSKHGITLTLHPITREILRGYIFQEEGGTRWEVVTDQQNIEPEALLKQATLAHNYFEGERPISSLGKLHFCYSAYATVTGGAAYNSHIEKA